MIKDLLRDLLPQVELVLSDEQLSQLEFYYELVIEKNKVMNLTAITDEKEFVIKHFIDSLSIVKAFDRQSFLLLTQNTTINSPSESLAGQTIVLSQDVPISVIDVGTGAGFPGMVLKIAFPKWKVTLFDSLQKRILFLQYVIHRLGLTDITAVHGRAEDFGHRNDYRGCFSLCVSRAVANISTLSEYCLPFVMSGGIFLSYKSGDCDEELKAAQSAIEVLGGSVEKSVYFTLPDSEDSRSLIVIRKVKITPEKYPRKAGVPSKKPLGTVKN